MIYFPTSEDLKLLKAHIKKVYCRIDLLDNDMNIVGSLEGLTVTGSESIDSESDIRRTFNASINIADNVDISEYSQDEWVNKYVHVYIGMKSPNSDVRWYSQGIYAFSQNGFTFDSENHTLSISCVDLVSKLNGTLGGAITGFGDKIQIDADTPIGEAIKGTFELSGLYKSIINYPDRVVPYDLE